MELEITDLTCRRAGRPVLSGLSFRVAPGEAVALRGPNGAGKSTLLRLLAGLLPVEGGTVRLGGVDLRRDGDGFAERVAYTGHLDAIKPQLTVAENLAFWAALYGGGHAPALAAFALESLADRPAFACSAGQKRRLGLARLLVSPQRTLWLLDEPTVSLDAPACALLFAAIRAHLAGGGMAIVATHAPLDLENLRELRLDPAAPPDPRRATAAGDPFLEGFPL